MNKGLFVMTANPKLFEIIMDIVVKDQNGRYSISMRDLCRIISVNVSQVNNFLRLHYGSQRQYPPTPHPELPLIDKQNKCFYIISNKEYKYTDQDIFCVTPDSTEALKFAFLDLEKFNQIETKYDIEFLHKVATTVSDCFMNAPRFENEVNGKQKQSFWQRLINIFTK